MPGPPVAVWFFFWKHCSAQLRGFLRYMLKNRAERTVVKACLIWGFWAQGRKAQQDQWNKGSCLSDLANWEGVRQRGEALMNPSNPQENGVIVAIHTTSNSDMSDSLQCKHIQQNSQCFKLGAKLSRLKNWIFTKTQSPIMCLIYKLNIYDINMNQWEWMLWQSPVEVPPGPRWRPRSRALSLGLQGQRVELGGSLVGARRWRGRGRRSTWWHYRGTQWQERSRSDASDVLGNATTQKRNSELSDLQVKNPWRMMIGNDVAVHRKHNTVNKYMYSTQIWVYYEFCNMRNVLTLLMALLIWGGRTPRLI